MSFTSDSKTTSTLTADARSSAGTFTSGSKSSQGVTWGSDYNTWALESRTWAQATSQLTLDTKN